MDPNGIRIAGVRKDDVRLLKARGVDLDGRLRPMETRRGASEPAPAFGLIAPRPNPAVGQTVFSFNLLREGDIDLRIWDVSGRCVRTLVGGRWIAGGHDIAWDGRNDAGERVPTGIYFAVLRAGPEPGSDEDRPASADGSPGGCPMNRLLGLAAIICLLAVGCGGGGGGTEPGAAPVAPSNLIATATSAVGVSLQWIDESTNEDGFRIERQTNSGWIQVGQIGENATVFSVSGLTPNTPYSFRVRAFNADGNSDYSNTASVTTPPEGTGPAAPTNLVAAAQSPTSILLSWTDGSNNETGFRIEVQDGATWLQAGEVAANTTSFLHAGLTPDTPYTYRVRAFNGNGSSSPSNTATDRTFSTGTITIAAGAASGVPGMTVSVAISMTTTLTSLTGYNVSVDYNPAKLELIDVRQERLGLPMFQFAEPSSGRVVFAATATGAFTMTSGSIALVRFRIKDGATGNAAVTPVAGEVSDGLFRPMQATGFTAGSVQIQ